MGQEIAYGAWVSSYSVLNKFSTKEHANFYSSLYWISITFFRLTLAFVPGPSSKKIEILASIGIVGSFASYFAIWHIDS